MTSLRAGVCLANLIMQNHFSWCPAEIFHVATCSCFLLSFLCVNEKALCALPIISATHWLTFNLLSTRNLCPFPQRCCLSSQAPVCDTSWDCSVWYTHYFNFVFYCTLTFWWNEIEWKTPSKHLAQLFKTHWDWVVDSHCISVKQCKMYIYFHYLYKNNVRGTCLFLRRI